MRRENGELESLARTVAFGSLLFPMSCLLLPFLGIDPHGILRAAQIDLETGGQTHVSVLSSPLAGPLV